MGASVRVAPAYCARDYCQRIQDRRMRYICCVCPSALMCETLAALHEAGDIRTKQSSQRELLRRLLETGAIPGSFCTTRYFVKADIPDALLVRHEAALRQRGDCRVPSLYLD